MNVKRIVPYLLFLVSLVMLGFLLHSPSRSFEELQPKYAMPPSQFMDFDGMRIHYRDEGKGEVIVLLHGTGASLHTWDSWTEVLKKKYRVIRFDLPAYGLTGQDPKKRYSSKDYVEILHTLMTRLQVDSFHLAGNSLGGLVSWLYASYYPERVTKLILLDPSGYGFSKTPLVIWLARTPILNSIIQFCTPRAFIQKNLREVYYDSSLIGEETIDRYHELSLYKGNRKAFIERAKLDRKDDTHRLKLIKAPTLIIWGAEDEWIPASNALLFKKEIPNSRLVVMPKTGHLPMEERPMESSTIALDFLSETH